MLLCIRRQINNNFISRKKMSHFSLTHLKVQSAKVQSASNEVSNNCFVLNTEGYHCLTCRLTVAPVTVKVAVALAVKISAEVTKLFAFFTQVSRM